MNQIDLGLKYPSLKIEFGYLFKIADLYKIDLSEANKKQWGGGRFGAIENDINLDIVGLLHKWINGENKKNQTLRNYLFAELGNFGYELDEIKKAIKIIFEYECRLCKKPINSNEYYHRAQLCLSCEITEDNN